MTDLANIQPINENENVNAMSIPEIKSLKNRTNNNPQIQPNQEESKQQIHRNNNFKPINNQTNNPNPKNKKSSSKKKTISPKKNNPPKNQLKESMFDDNEPTFEEKYGIYESKMLAGPILCPKNYLKSLNNQLDSTSNEMKLLQLLNYNTLKETFTQCSCFPEKKRKYIWEYLFSLPYNKVLFEEYSSKKVHPFYKFINQMYPLASPTEQHDLQNVCSLLSHWSAQVGNIYFLPHLVFPFIKSFPKDNLFVFEILMAVFSSIANFWFEYYPGCPLYHLKLSEKIIKLEKPQVYNKIKEIYVKSNIVQMKMVELIWRLVRHLFSESLIKEQWLQVMDFLICYNHKPETILYFSASFIMKLEPFILKATDAESLKKVLFEVNQTVTLSTVFKQSLQLMKKYNRYQLYKYKPYIPYDAKTYPKVFKNFPREYILNTTELEKGMLEMDIEYEHKDSSVKTLEDKYRNLLNAEKKVQRHFISEINKEHEKDNIMKHELDVALFSKVTYQKELIDRKIEKLDNINSTVKRGINILQDLNEAQKLRVGQETDIKRSFQNNVLKQKEYYNKMSNIDVESNKCLNKMADLRNKKVEDMKLMNPIDFDRVSRAYIDRLGDPSYKNNPYGNDEYYPNSAKRDDILSIQKSVRENRCIENELYGIEKANNKQTEGLSKKLIAHDDDGEMIRHPTENLGKKEVFNSFEGDNFYEEIEEDQK